MVRPQLEALAPRMVVELLPVARRTVPCLVDMEG